MTMLSNARNARVLLGGLLTLAISLPAFAQNFDRAAGDLDTRLQSSLHELASVREEITREKMPLSRVVLKLEDEVLELRRKQAQLLEGRDSRAIDLDTLERQVESFKEQDDFVESRLKEFVREFEGRLHISEMPRYSPLTGAAILAEKDSSLEYDGRREKQLAVVEAAMRRIGDQLGGDIFEGEALSPEGVLTQGRFIALGPTIFYASEDGSTVGLVESQLNAADPVVVGLPGGLDEGIIEVAKSSAGTLPFDSTLGKALKKEKARKGLGDYVVAGGAVGYVIIGLGVAALLLTGFKAYEIGRFEVPKPEDVDPVLEELAKGSQAGAAKRAQQIPGVGGAMLEVGVEHASEEREDLEEVLFEKILRARPGLERFLPFLAITAAAAPLLGLLGTVIGMIKTFHLITIFGTGDAKSLSSGISEALVTTALGLIVAIPTLILHGGLNRMARHKLGLLEQLSAAFVNGVAGLRYRAEQLASNRTSHGGHLDG